MGKMQMVELDPVKMQTFMNQTDARALDLALGKAPGYLVKTKQRCKMPAGVYRLLCKLTELPDDALTPDPEPEHTADDPLPGQMELTDDAPKPVKYHVHSEWNTTEVFYDLYCEGTIVLSLIVPRTSVNNGDCLTQAFSHLSNAIMEAAQP